MYNNFHVHINADIKSPATNGFCLRSSLSERGHGNPEYLVGSKLFSFGSFIFPIKSLPILMVLVFKGLGSLYFIALSSFRLYDDQVVFHL